MRRPGYPSSDRESWLWYRSHKAHKLQKQFKQNHGLDLELSWQMALNICIRILEEWDLNQLSRWSNHTLGGVHGFRLFLELEPTAFNMPKYWNWFNTRKRKLAQKNPTDHEVLVKGKVCWNNPSEPYDNSSVPLENHKQSHLCNSRGDGGWTPIHYEHQYEILTPRLVNIKSSICPRMPMPSLWVWTLSQLLFHYAIYRPSPMTCGHRNRRGIPKLQKLFLRLHWGMCVCGHCVWVPHPSPQNIFDPYGYTLTCIMPHLLFSPNTCNINKLWHNWHNF